MPRMRMRDKRLWLAVTQRTRADMPCAACGARRQLLYTAKNRGPSTMLLLSYKCPLDWALHIVVLRLSGNEPHSTVLLGSSSPSSPVCMLLPEELTKDGPAPKHDKSATHIHAHTHKVKHMGWVTRQQPESPALHSNPVDLHQHVDTPQRSHSNVHNSTQPSTQTSRNTLCSGVGFMWLSPGAAKPHHNTLPRGTS